MSHAFPPLGPHLLSIPVELQRQIILYLDPIGVTRCLRVRTRELCFAVAHPSCRASQTCRYLLWLISHDLTIIYKLELARAGMINGPLAPGRAEMHVRLAALRAYRVACITGRLPLIRYMIPTTSNRPIVSDGFWFFLTARHFVLLQQPSAFLGIPGQRIFIDRAAMYNNSRHGPAPSIKYCAVDMTQDHIVVASLSSLCERCVRFSTSRQVNSPR